MIPWIQVYSNLVRHPKVTKLADKLGLTSKDAGPNVIASGMLVSLWLWAAQNATDGDLSECTDRAIADAAEFKRKPSLFVEALIYAKLLDEDRKLHNWDEYATLLIDCEDRQREKTRQRVANHRARKKAMKEAPGNGECNGDGNVTDTPGNAPTIPYHTIPNHTLPNFNTGAAGESTRARAATDSELASIGIKPGEYYGLTADFVETVRQTTVALFNKYKIGTPQLWDYRQVSRYCGSSGRAALLDYAFEQSGVAGKFGDWRYVDGIMDRLFMRGIETEAQARQWDSDRPDWENEE